MCCYAYEKHVHCRFTVDDFADGRRGSGCVWGTILCTDNDRFVFAIALSEIVDLEHNRLILCPRYYIRGLEFWDSNDGSSLRVEFLPILRTFAIFLPR